SQPSPTTPALTTEGGAPNLSELYLQLEEQNQTISDLTRKVEELTHAQDVLKEQLFKMQADTDLRFQEANKPSQSNPQPPPSPKTDKEAYDAAYNLLIKAKYPEAERAFTAFLRDYPNSSLAGNANYWLGETYYVRGEYQVAAGIFSDGLTKYEKSTKAPDNLLKLGLTMANLKEKDEACGFFKLMPEQFPKANETLKQRAKQEAKKLACP
ncbi:MAG: tol-pal system protein YbgF, partial [Pseudomonadota bacterium]|nr:tol-pal system protein YbgF [Pseudomonadota bacterium]